MPTAPQQRPLGLRSLAAELSLPREWLLAQALAGNIPALRVGDRLLFNAAAVRQALAILAAESSAVKEAANDS